MVNGSVGAPPELLAEGQGELLEKTSAQSVAPLAVASSAATASSASAASASSVSSSPSKRAPGEVSSLLHFVHAVGTDIQAVLDRSAPCKRSVDHRKYLQKQLRRFSADSPAADDLLSKSDHFSTGLPCGQLIHQNFNPMESNTVGSDGTKRNTPVGDRENQQNEGPAEVKQPQHKHMTTQMEAMTSSKTVPLRQRQLPASFWQEPNQPSPRTDNPLPVNAHGSLLPIYPQLMANGYDPRTLDPAACYPPAYSTGCMIGLPGEPRVPSAGGHPDLLLSSAYYPKFAPDLPYPWAAYGLPIAEDKLSRTTLLSLESAYNKPFPRPLPTGHVFPSWEGSALHSSRHGVWRPIPTKTLATSSSRRYHPFTDVR